MRFMESTTDRFFESRPGFGNLAAAIGREPVMRISTSLLAVCCHVCSLQLPQVTASYACNDVKCAEAVLGNHDVAEVLFFATEGLHNDLPSAKALLKRLRILADQFARD